MTPSKDDPEQPQKAEILPFRTRPQQPKPRRQAAPDDDPVEPLSTAALVKIAVLAVFLIVAGVWLMNKLRDIGRLEDCAMQGRRNCVTVPVPDRNQ